MKKTVIITLISGLIAFVFYTFIYGSSERKNNPALIKKIKSLSLNQLDTLKIPQISTKDYMLLTDYAIGLVNDTINMDGTTKGQVLLSVIANHLTIEIKNKTIDYKSDDMIILEKKFAEQQYFINQQPISDVLKLAHHACEGEYLYIYSRFKVKWYFIPVVIIFSSFLILSIMVFFNLIKWKYKKAYSITFLVFSILFLILIIIFNKTCNDNITEKTLYGIPF